jgi:hypothetical protein
MTGEALRISAYTPQDKIASFISNNSSELNLIYVLTSQRDKT